MSQMLALWNGEIDDVAAAESIYARDFVGNGRQVGVDAVKSLLLSSRRAFPNQHYDVHDEIVAGDHVVLRLVWTGMHEGDWQSPVGPLPATGRSFTVGGVEIFEIGGEDQRGVGLLRHALATRAARNLFDRSAVATQRLVRHKRSSLADGRSQRRHHLHDRAALGDAHLAAKACQPLVARHVAQMSVQNSPAMNSRSPSRHWCVVNFWSTGHSKGAQSVAKGIARKAAPVSQTAKADERSQRFSPRSHPGGRRFESG
jgi:predicted ester cyclase